MKSESVWCTSIRMVIILMISLLVKQGYCQAEVTKRLHIGDTIPPMVWKMLNGKDSLFDLGKVHSKLTILSLWTPSCSFSSGQLSELYRLEKVFPYDLTLLPIGFDGGDIGLTERYLSSHKGTSRAVQTYTAVEQAPFTQSTLYKMLPFVGLPQNVWLDSNHVILAITDHLPLTEQNIRRGIAGDKLSFELKDYDFDFDATNPLLINNNGGVDSAFSYRSLITPYNPRISLGDLHQHTDNYTRIAIGNVIPISLLQMAVINGDTTGLLPAYDPMNKRLINKVRDNDLFGTAWYELPVEENESAIALRKKQTFCYDLVMPPSFSFTQAYQKMKEDLCAFFAVKASIQMTPEAVLQMVVTNHKNLQLTDTDEEQIIVSEDHLSYRFLHCRLRRVAEVLNSFLNLPIIVGTMRQSGAVEISFQLSALDDIMSLRKGFEKCGIRLIEKRKKLGMIVIKNR